MNNLQETKLIKAKLYALPAGQGDCLLFQYQDNNRKYHNILIDGGNRNRLEFNKQKKKILEIVDRGKKGKLDLVIVTHSDDDHISGILKLLVDSDLEPLVGKIWFNSERTISDFLGVKSRDTQKYPIMKSKEGIIKSSRNQDNNLYGLLNNDVRWNKEIILSGKKERIENLDITVLSPMKENLEVLNNYWPSQTLGVVKSSGTKKFDYDVSLDEFVKNSPKFKEDIRPVNGSSIALLLEWMDKKFLLLSDAFPSVIVESLNQLNLEIPIKIDAMKVSHHGSKGNTSKELLDSFECNNYIISANANKKHFHPDKETLCRILIYNGIENTTFHFTHENLDLKRIFISESNVNTTFPKVKEEGVCFSYEC
ncbi:ComEC/Rec2 family competence protein [Aliivibrio fischeri]|uniref:ComEC/Rec2 family competence protein n=1 Tax=Aliivibrio fischeri TaxID=668 RepID=UPI0007C4B6C2|nr:MBL fold metallo-hydrolase [Aliivibrio fischeri]